MFFSATGSMLYHCPCNQKNLKNKNDSFFLIKGFCNKKKNSTYSKDTCDILQGPVYFCVSKMFLKKFIFFYFFLCFKLIFFLVFSNHFDVIILKIIFLKKKHYFDTFPSEKYFEKKPLPDTQILSTTLLKENPY
jgi:hypothetical protein